MEMRLWRSLESLPVTLLTSQFWPHSDCTKAIVRNITIRRDIIVAKNILENFFRISYLIGKNNYYTP
jgi:hypothetical protein